MPRPENVGVGVGIVLLKRRMHESYCILLGKRKGAHGAGSWSVPGGWIEAGEEPLDTVIREAKEEANIDLWAGKVVEVIGGPQESEEFYSLTVFFESKASWSGIPKNNEPHKCEGWKWFPLESKSLPRPLFQSIPIFLSKRFFLDLDILSKKDEFEGKPVTFV